MALPSEGLAGLVLQGGSLAAGALGLTSDRALRGPVYAQAGIIDRCNYRCVTCGYHPPSGGPVDDGQFGGTAPGAINPATFHRVVDDLRRLGTRQLDLVGRGEPLLHPEAARFVRYAKDRGLVVTLTTNGSPLTERIARDLLNGGLDRLRISLNAGTPETYGRFHSGRTPRDFLRVREAASRFASLRRSLGARTHVAASFVVGSLNRVELPAMVRLAADIGADAAHFQFGVRMSGADPLALTCGQHQDLVERVVPEALALSRTLGVQTDLAALGSSLPPCRMEGGPPVPAVVPCYVGFFFSLVLGNGNVVGCCQTRSSLGNVESSGFEAVWNGDAYRRFRRAGRRLPACDAALETCECDSCFFRPHNVTIHNLLHPLARIPRASGEHGMALSDWLRLSRLE